MPADNPRARYPSNQSRVAIPTLLGGVGRQAPSKRALNEAQELDNVLCTVERSVEKRMGTEYLQRYDAPDFADIDVSNLRSDLNLANSAEDADYYFAWFQVSDAQRYLIAIEYSTVNTNNLLKVFRFTNGGFYECVAPTVTTEMLEYITYGNADYTADEALKVITVGPQLLILNTKVSAGYTSIERTITTSESIYLNGSSTETTPSVDTKYWVQIGLDGEPKTDDDGYFYEDVDGRKLVYFTTVPVDPEGEASIYIQNKFYIKNDQVFYRLDSGTDLEPYLKRRYNIDGTIEFGDILDDGSHAYQWTTLDEEVPYSLIDFHVHEVKVIADAHNPDTAADDSLRLTFTVESGRDRFEELDKFFLATHDVPVDNTVYVKSDNDTGSGATEWYITWTDTTADPIEAIENIATDLNSDWDADTTVQTEPFSIRGIVTDYAFPASLENRVTDHTTGDYTLTEDTTVIFTCVREGIAESEEPAFESDAGTDAAAFTLRLEDDGGAVAFFIPVEDWKYPEAAKRYLGQALDDFSEFNFPPKDNDPLNDSEGKDEAVGPPVITYNKPNTDMEGIVHATLGSLYDYLEIGDAGRTEAGTGKIYNIENSYAGEAPGFYIVTQIDDRPYVRRIRTPFEYSVLDAGRFPKVMKIASFDSNDLETFEINDMDLEQRRAGNLSTNPGPKCFNEGRQHPISAMALFRNRLFLSSGDIVFSSRLNDFSDFWLRDPGSLNDKDPIETTLSTNKYSEVSTMTPFDDYLFINTGSDIQFTMKGSENTITPFNAEVSPTAFYSTAPLVSPVLLGSQVYFFAPRRAYVYFSDSTVSINQAIEVSQHCPNYLPSSFGEIAVIPGYDTIAMIDKGDPKFVYMYTNRYSGSDVTQNAFFRYNFDTDVSSIASFDNQVYFVQKYAIWNGSSYIYKYFLEVMEFYEENINQPRLDHQLSFTEAAVLADPEKGQIDYDSSTGHTTIVVNHYANTNPDTLYINVNETDPSSGVAIDLVSGQDDGSVISVGTSNGTLTIVLNGDYTTDTNYREFTVGTKYTMTVQLSPQFVRDQNQNVVEGTFSMRTLHLRHHNTGSYRIEKAIRGRREVALEYSPSELDEVNVIDEDLNMPLPSYEKDGESFTKILGFAAETDIYIISDSSNPVNVTQIEIRGKFNNHTSGFVR